MKPGRSGIENDALHPDCLQVAGPVPAEKQSVLALLPLLALLFSWGTGLCLYTGRVGFMPLDQSIVFDGAWRLLSGQVPFRDFTTPDGITPIAFQVLFFKAFGVTWFAFCLHAAVFNGLFCILVYALLRTLRAGQVVALLYGALSGVVFYPPFGTPYRDQHAFFFFLLAILMVVLATHRRPSWKTDLLWLGVPFAVALAYLSKQIPSVFVVPLLLLYVAIRDRNRAVRALVLMGVGSVLAAAVLCVVGWALRAQWEWIRVYFYELPVASGADRLKELVNPHAVLEKLMSNKMLSRWTDPGIALFLVSGLLVPALYAFLARRFHTRKTLRVTLLMSATAVLFVLVMSGLVLGYLHNNAWPFWEISLGLMLVTASGVAIALGRGTTIAHLQDCFHDFLPEGILAVGMTWTCLVFALLTYHAYENSLALVFAGLGVAQSCLIRLAGTVNRQIGKPGMLWKTRRFLVKGLPWSFAVLALIQAVSFHRHVNVGRTVHGLDIQPSQDLNGSIVSPALAFLNWDVPSFVKGEMSTREHAESVHSTLRFLEDQDGNFLLIGDSSILYALTGRPSVLPSLWFHPGLTIPPEDTEAFRRYQSRLIESLDRYGVRFVVLEGERTWVKTQLSTFPLLDELVQRRGEGTRQFGQFKIIELSQNGN